MKVEIYTAVKIHTKRLFLIFKTWYMNRYSFNYLIDAITGRQLKYRMGQCKRCGKCCRFVDGGHCENLLHIKQNDTKCMVYNNRNCNITFPVNQEELDYFKNIFPDLDCGYFFYNPLIKWKKIKTYNNLGKAFYGKEK